MKTTIKTFLIIIFSILILKNSKSQNCDTVTTQSLNDLYESAIKTYATNYTTATSILNQIIGLDSNFVKSYYSLGKINYDEFLKEQNQYSRYSNAEYGAFAIKNFNKAYEKCPKYKQCLSSFYLGDIYFRQKKYNLSLPYLTYFSKNTINKTQKTIADQYIEKINIYNKLINNPVKYNPKLVDGVCSSKDEYLPLISPNAEFFFYTRRTKNGTGTNDYIEEFTYSTKIDSTDSYTTGTPMVFPFNDGRIQGGATITIDNLLMFITICEYERSYYTSFLNCDLYYSINKDGAWTSLKKLDNNINNTKFFEGQPSIATDGATVYFSSNRDGGLGGFDIYKIIKKDDGTWSDPINLGNVINTTLDEKTPFIHTDNKTLYYSSNGFDGVGGFDIYASSLGTDSIWSKPLNIGYPINTDADEVAFIVSIDGERIYFSGENESNGWDIFSNELPQTVKPSKVLLLTGDITDENGKVAKNAKVELTNVVTLEQTEGMVDKKTGKYAVSTTVESNDKFILTVNSDGTFFDTYEINPNDSTYKPPTKINIELHTVEKELPIELKTVNFETNSAELNQESIICINQLITFLEVNSALVIKIHGHTDNVGSSVANLELSRLRAKAVKDYLIEHGIDKVRVSSEGFGEKKPVASNDTEIGKANNRRVEFIVVGN